MIKINNLKIENGILQISDLAYEGDPISLTLELLKIVKKLIENVDTKISDDKKKKSLISSLLGELIVSEKELSEFEESDKVAFIKTLNGIVETVIESGKEFVEMIKKYNNDNSNNVNNNDDIRRKKTMN